MHRSVAKRVFGEHNVKLADLTMASEDFAFMVSGRGGEGGVVITWEGGGGEVREGSPGIHDEWEGRGGEGSGARALALLASECMGEKVCACDDVQWL